MFCGVYSFVTSTRPENTVFSGRFSRLIVHPFVGAGRCFIVVYYWKRLIHCALVFLYYNNFNIIGYSLFWLLNYQALLAQTKSGRALLDVLCCLDQRGRSWLHVPFVSVFSPACVYFLSFGAPWTVSVLVPSLAAMNHPWAPSLIWKWVTDPL